MCIRELENHALYIYWNKFIIENFKYAAIALSLMGLIVCYLLYSIVNVPREYDGPK